MRRAWLAWSIVLASCATPIAGPTQNDANVDAWGDASWGPPPTVVAGGGTPDAGIRDADRVGGCGARLLVIFDRSGSMGDPWMASGPKWQVAERALAAAIEPRASQLTVGAILFPSTNAGIAMTCAAVDPIASQMPFQPGASFLTAWNAFWTTPTLLGSTPIDSAFDSADAALTSAARETAVVLLTDGEPTCSGMISSQTRAASWLARGIRTFVVGLPGSSLGMTTLDAIASAGGTTVISVDDPSALSTALGTITSTHVQSQCP